MNFATTMTAAGSGETYVTSIATTHILQYTIMVYNGPNNAMGNEYTSMLAQLY